MSGIINVARVVQVVINIKQIRQQNVKKLDLKWTPMYGTKIIPIYSGNY